MPNSNLLALSADEIEAEERISGGNLSATSQNNAMVGIDTPLGPDAVLAQIYHENVAHTQATYKLDAAVGEVEIL